MRDGEPGQGSLSDGEAGRVKPLPLIGGVLLGWLLCWMVFAFVLLFGYSSLGDLGWSAHGTWIAGAGLLAVPLVCLVVLGYRALHRQLRVGMLLGMTIGSVVGAGVCFGAGGLS